MTRADQPKRVVVLGATGTIGRATVRQLTHAGHEVTAVIRPGRRDTLPVFPARTILRAAEVSNPSDLATRVFEKGQIDAVVSCLASRTGAPDDAWAIDHQANLNALKIAKAAGVSHFVLISAICVQKPRLAFQFAKLAFEETLIASGMTYSIVRPTAFFKSLSGQIDRLKQGKPFLVFGFGRLTACKPISDDDLGRFVVQCLADPSLHNRVLPIGGPGAAITPLEQATYLCQALDQPVRVRRVPPGLLSGIAGFLSVMGRVFPSLREKAELARIGHYYATESMLLWDDKGAAYDADKTPSFGTETLFSHYDDLLNGTAQNERVDQPVF